MGERVKYGKAFVVGHLRLRPSVLDQEAADLIDTQAAEIIEQIRWKNVAAREREEALAMLEEVLSSDSDMPSHQDTMNRAEALIDAAQSAVQETKQDD